MSAVRVVMCGARGTQQWAFSVVYYIYIYIYIYIYSFNKASRTSRCNWTSKRPQNAEAEQDKAVLRHFIALDAAMGRGDFFDDAALIKSTQFAL